MRIPKIRPVLYGTIAIGVVALVLRVTPSSEMSTMKPAVGIAAFTLDSRPFFRAATVEYVQTQRFSPATYRTAQAIALEQPLASGPFAVAAVAAAKRGDARRAIALLEAARLRNPRDRFARLLLAEHYTRTGALAKAMDELITLYRLVPDARAVLIDLMTRIARDPQGFTILANTLRGEEALGPLLANLVQTGAPVDRILTLARAGTRPNDPAQKTWQPLLLQRLVNEGRFDEARRLWASFAQLSPADAAKPFYNLGFARSAALPPFNWKSGADTIGAVDFLPRGKAAITYFGRESGPLVYQLLTLAPGQHRFRFTTEGGRADDRGVLAWRIRCALAGQSPTAGDTLMESTITKAVVSKRGASVTFTVPAKCPAQWLLLEGTGSEFPTTVALEVGGLTLEGGR